MRLLLLASSCASKKERIFVLIRATMKTPKIAFVIIGILFLVLGILLSITHTYIGGDIGPSRFGSRLHHGVMSGWFLIVFSLVLFWYAYYIGYVKRKRQ